MGNNREESGMTIRRNFPEIHSVRLALAALYAHMRAISQISFPCAVGSFFWYFVEGCFAEAVRRA